MPTKKRAQNIFQFSLKAAAAAAAAAAEESPELLTLPRNSIKWPIFNKEIKAVQEILLIREIWTEMETLLLLKLHLLLDWSSLANYLLHRFLTEKEVKGFINWLEAIENA